MRYRHRSTEVEAVRWTGDNFVEIDEFIDVPHSTYPSIGQLFLPTPGGVQRAVDGDWIVKDAAGWYYPVKPEDFEKTYEAVGEQT